MEKKKNAISIKSIKIHLFYPSKREIWTIIGNRDEYWLDPELDFCTCKGYYFNKLNEKESCYHLDLIKKCDNEYIDIIEFSDDEYNEFLCGVIEGIYKK